VEEKEREASAAGAYTRPLLRSTSAVSDTKYTLNTPSYPKHPVHTPYTTSECTPYPIKSAYIEPKSRRG
jgi:hypothetical protein